MSRRWALLLVAVVAVAAVAAVAAWRWPARDAVVRLPEDIEDYVFWQPKPLTDFRLVAADGRVLGLPEMKGKWNFVFFGYTHCPDVCPMTMLVLAQAFALLEKKPGLVQEMRGVFVSVDPKRDTPELLRAYVAHFNDGFMGVTGDDGQLEAFARQMGALYTVQPRQAQAAADDYLVSHNSTIFLVDPQGRLYGRFPPPQAAPEIADAFVRIRAFYKEGMGK